ncbi:hypothetical protein ACFQY7_29905 [Actinomadura luteofluorescens]|uniref:hypothetical protein n=1 Tax=Actinomadura luteofluorescens TaxID=46163 RepID=UPI00362A05B6
MAAITSAGRFVPGTARTRLVILLGALTIALGGAAAWSNAQERDLTGAASAQNDALSDNGRTAEVKGQVTTAVNTVFSYNYADVAKTEKAAQELLTGKAVQQYNQLFALVRKQAPQQKQVLTTAVTDSAVKSLAERPRPPPRLRRPAQHSHRHGQDELLRGGLRRRRPVRRRQMEDLRHRHPRRVTGAACY